MNKVEDREPPIYGKIASPKRTKSEMKKTEIGWIPKDWEVSIIKKIGTITTGGRDTQDRVNDGLYPFFVRSNTIEKINSFSYDGEAVLTAGDGVGVGKVFHYVKGKFDFHQRVYKISDFLQNVDGYFFYLYFSNNFLNRITSMTAKSSVDSVRMEMIANMSIPLPPLPEQKAIAQVLSDIDQLITATDALLQKKQAIKQGAMQQLLTGKKRLEGFEGEWEVKELGEISELTSSKRVFLSDYVKIGIPFYRGKEITELKKNIISTDVIYISEKAYLYFKSKFGVPVKNDILITAVGTLGNVYRVRNNRQFYFKDGNLIWLKNISHYSPFIEYLLEYSRREILDTAIGSSQKALTIQKLNKLEFFIPPIQEQKAIAQILSDMDTEIEALQSQKAKYEALKQGAMQQLLTGKIRLPLTVE